MAQHEWGLSWGTIEAAWTDEYLWMMLRAARDRLRWRREWEFAQTRLLASALGAKVPDLPGPPAKSGRPMSRADRAAIARALGGKYEVTH